MTTSKRVKSGDLGMVCLKPLQLASWKNIFRLHEQSVDTTLECCMLTTNEDCNIMYHLHLCAMLLASAPLSSRFPLPPFPPPDF
jgi:hypothetical protein